MGRLAQLAANPQGTTPRGNLSGRRLALPHPGHWPERARTRADARNSAPPDPRRRNGDPHRAGRAAGRRYRPRRTISSCCSPTTRSRSRGPLILRSPLLTDEDALRLIAECERRASRSRRRRAPHIGEPVTDALARSEAESVLVALVRNATARISAAALRDAGREIAHASPAAGAAGAPRRPSAALATRMCEWVSDALKTYIAQNYKIAPDQVESRARSGRTGRQKRAAEPPKSPPAESAQKLIDKLAVSGQLKAGFLLRVLQSGPDRSVRSRLRAGWSDLPAAEHALQILRDGPARRGARLPRRRHRPLRLHDRLQPVPPGPAICVPTSTAGDMAEVQTVFSHVSARPARWPNSGQPRQFAIYRAHLLDWRHDRSLRPPHHLSARLRHRPLRFPLRLLHAGTYDVPAQGGAADAGGTGAAVRAPSSPRAWSGCASPAASRWCASDVMSLFERLGARIGKAV